MHKTKYNKASSKIAKRNKTRKNIGLFLKIGLPVGFIVGLILFLRADFLQVQNFEVSGAQALSQIELKSVATKFISGNKFFIIPKSDIFFVNKNQLSALLLSQFPRMETVEVNKQLFSRQINLSVTERGADYLWCSKTDECFFMSKNGLVFEKVGFTGSEFLTSSSSWLEPKNKLIFKGGLDGDPIMKNFVTPEKMKVYEKFIESFKSAGVTIITINIESSDKATAKSNIGDIIFNPEETDLSISTQNAILLINEEKAKNPNAIFNYIDTRFGNKMFYKLI